MINKLLQGITTGAVTALSFASQVSAAPSFPKDLSPTNSNPNPATTLVREDQRAASLPSPIFVAQARPTSDVARNREESTSQQQPQGTPSSSSAVTPRQRVFTQRGDEAAATIFLDSQQQLNQRLTEGADKATELLNQVPGS
jgi:hypothetical protein